MQPGGESDDAVSELGLGHGVGDDGFNQFAAFRAIATRDDVLDRLRFDLGDILDDTGAFF